MRVLASSGARSRRSEAIAELTGITASAAARRDRFICRFALMYGTKGNASGQSVPARGRTHRVIMPAEQAGQSTSAAGS